MTQVKDMSNYELDCKLAELMGHKFIDSREIDRCGIKRMPEGTIEYFEPCTDPAASLEVQAKALGIDHNGYIPHLGKITQCGRTDLDEMFKDMLLASPRERAEAVYITLSSVKE